MWNKDVNYSKAIEVLLGDEAGFANYKADRGGMTYAGVSERYFPKWEGWNLIYKHLEKFTELRIPYIDAPDEVIEFDEILSKDSELQESLRDFYFTFFWMPMHLDKIVSYEKCLLIFTTGVMSGKNTAAKYQQICADVKVDKIIGPISIRETNNIPDKQFCFQFLLEVQEYLTYITYNNSENRKFFLGWSGRNMKQYKRILESFKNKMPVCI
jgi:lysozyme family protein